MVSVGDTSKVLGVDYRMLVMAWGVLLLVLVPIKGWVLAFFEADISGT